MTNDSDLNKQPKRTAKTTARKTSTAAERKAAAAAEFEIQVPVTDSRVVDPKTGKATQLIPTSYSHKAITREEVEIRFHLAFELIGGVERMAAWADSNPTEFYRMYAKLLPDQKVTATAPSEIKISLGEGLAIPHSPLDEIEIRDESEVNARYLKKTNDGSASE